MITETLKDGTVIKYIQIENGISVTLKDTYGQIVEFDITYAEIKSLPHIIPVTLNNIMST